VVVDLVARTTGTVSLATLIQKGVLKTGDKLVVRRRSAPAIEATLQADGSLKIGNTSFATPSGAAKHALDVGSIDGWLRWRVPRLGDRSIAELREEL
jgi:hypothetical protein